MMNKFLLSKPNRHKYPDYNLLSDDKSKLYDFDLFNIKFKSTCLGDLSIHYFLGDKEKIPTLVKLKDCKFVIKRMECLKCTTQK